MVDLFLQVHCFCACFIEHISQESRQLEDRPARELAIVKGQGIDIIERIEQKMRLELCLQKTQFTFYFLDLQLPGFIDLNKETPDDDKNAGQHNHRTNRQRILGEAFIVERVRSRQISLNQASRK